MRSVVAASAGATLVIAQRRDSEFVDLGAMPAPIKALKSRRAEAKPITTAERKNRIERARQLMQQHKIDAVCMIGGTSLAYYTGIHWGNSERLFAFILPQKGRAFYVSPAFEEDRAREQIAHAPEGDSCARLW